MVNVKEKERTPPPRFEVFFPYEAFIAPDLFPKPREKTQNEKLYEIMLKQDEL